MQTSVLVVDGIDSDRMRLQQMLEPRVQFDGVKTGGEALTYIKRNSVDLLLLSVKLPIKLRLLYLILLLTAFDHRSYY